MQVLPMQEKLDYKLIAPCGMNCAVCYVHLKKRKPCKGCLCDDMDKPERCKSCAIKSCVKDKGATYCFQCSDFPCKKIVNLDKSYQKRYQVSLLENSQKIRDNGFECFLISEKERWKCPGCGGIISLHDKECSECGSKE